MNANQSPSFWNQAWKPALGVAILGSLALLAGAVWSIWSDLGEGDQTFVYYTVVNSDLPIVVTERGNLESQVETKIRCEVQNISYGRGGNAGTQIIHIIPNGSAVKKDDLLVEFDSAGISDKLDQQMLAYEQMKSKKIQTQAKYENQKTQNETLKAQAELKVTLSELDLEMYIDANNGTHILAQEAIKRLLDEARAGILEAQGELELAKTEKSGMEELFKLGYRGKAAAEGIRFKYLKTEGDLAAAFNKLRNKESELSRLDSYELKKQTLTLEGAVATAIRDLKQVLTDNISLLAQAEAAKFEADASETKEKERLENLETQLGLCKIYAPHDGMVVYARGRSRYSSGSEVAEGATVHQRQELITLPDLSQMQVKTQVHEAVLDQVRTGLPVGIRIDAFPNRPYTGYVHDVAVVPTSSYYSNVKSYECTIRIAGEVEQLKPGMTAVVEIHVDRIRDVLSIPVQAVVQIESETWCYVDNGDGIERRDLELGRSNDKFVHIVKGLVARDRVVLNPSAILDETKDEDGLEGISPESGAKEAPEVPEAAIAAEEAKKKEQLFQEKGDRGRRSKGDKGGLDKKKLEALRRMREKRD